MKPLYKKIGLVLAGLIGYNALAFDGWNSRLEDAIKKTQKPVEASELCDRLLLIWNSHYEHPIWHGLYLIVTLPGRPGAELPFVIHKDKLGKPFIVGTDPKYTLEKDNGIFGPEIYCKDV